MNDDGDYVSLFLENLLKGDRAACSVIVRQYLFYNTSIMDLYENILKKALYEVGILWETNKISVATEHMCTAITEAILNELLFQIISSKSYNKKVIVACVENEQHQVGIKMVADVFEMNGWESVFLGTGIPTNELIRFIHEQNPDILAISLSVYFNYSNLLQMLQVIISTFPNLHILVGGQALSRSIEPGLKDMANVKIIPDLYVLDKYIKALNSISK